VKNIAYPSVLDVVSAAERTLIEQIGQSNALLKFLTPSINSNDGTR